MDIKSKATEYVDDALLDSLREIVEKAYADGYAEGCEDSKSSVDVELDDDDWVDLGLPSGLLWSKDYLRDEAGEIIYGTYSQAIQYSIPTENDWMELRENCKTDLSGIYKTFQGPNGEMLNFYCYGREECGVVKDKYERAYLWIEDEQPSGNDRSCISLENYAYSSLSSTFQGFGLPIRLVREK